MHMTPSTPTRGRPGRRRVFGVLASAALALIPAGCRSLGPSSISHDRLGYAQVMGDSWKEQTLLNIVRLRYADAPVFLDVSSVIASYATEQQINLGAGFGSGAVANTQQLGAYGRFTDKPTISYTPLTGDKFSRSLLRPIPPSAVFSMIQAGYPADYILRATTRAINGHYNRGVGAHNKPADPEFQQLIAAVRSMQDADGVAMRVERMGDQDVTLLLFRPRPQTQLSSDFEKVRTLLGLPEDAGEVRLNYGANARAPGEVAMLTRSMLEILIDFSTGIEVPESHVSEGRAFATTTGVGVAAPLARIRVATARPAQAYAAVPYRGSWYWIDDGDIESKRAFTFMMMFFSLAETGTTNAAPVITVGVN